MRRLVQSRRLVLCAALIAGALATSLVGAALSPAAAERERDVYRELSREGRMRLQDALVWTGHYQGDIDGALRGGTSRAIRDFQRSIGERGRGALSRAAAERLIGEARAAKDAAGFAAYDDPGTGIRVGLPLGLAPPVGAGVQGSRFAAPDGSVVIELFRIPENEGGLRQIYQRIRRDARRRITYGRLSRDWFVASGSEQDRQFYMRARRHGSGTLAFAVVYTEAAERAVEPAIVAMSNSFADPESLSVTESSTEQGQMGAAAEGEALPPEGSRPAPAARDEGAAGRPARTGGRRAGDDAPVAASFAVSTQGHFLTTARIAGCPEVAVGGFGPAELVAADRRNDLALLKVDGAADLLVAPLSSAGPSEGLSVIAAQIRSPDSPGYMAVGQITALTAPDGDTSRVQVTIPPRSDDGGAPLLDEAGRIVAMLLPMTPDEAARGAATPGGGSRMALRLGLAEAFLSAHGVAPGAAPAAGDAKAGEALELARRMTHPVFCARATTTTRGPPD